MIILGIFRHQTFAKSVTLHRIKIKIRFYMIHIDMYICIARTRLECYNYMYSLAFLQIDLGVSD